ncbi:EAL domain-containing protein [Euzebya sp.]|uniref:bifunctional diguanylate cyclase/phosphodiesterase n=1 Tax=Euzebya sp. TaxID=1971409 RepID=UPI00351823B5
MRTYLVLIVATAAVAVLAASAYGFVWTDRTTRAQTLDDMAVVTGQAAEAVTTTVDQSVQIVDGLLAQPNLVDGLVPNDACSLATQGAGVFPTLRLELVTADGTITCTSTDDPAAREPGVHADQAWLAQVLAADGTTVVWDGVDGLTARPVVAVGAPLGPDGDPAGVVVNLMFVDETATAMTEVLPGAGDAVVTVVDTERRQVVSASPASPIGVGDGVDDVPRSPRGDWRVDAGERLYQATADVGGTPWAITAAVPRDVVVGIARDVLWREILVGVVALAFVALAAFVLDRRVAAPLRRITAAVVAGSRDPASAHVDPGGTAELTELAAQVNAMLDIRAGHEAQLHHRTTHDLETGLPNATALLHAVGAALEDPEARHGASLVAIGSSRIGLVTQSRGYAAAAALLAEAAGRLGAVVPAGGLLARGHDDVLVVLLPDADGAAGIRIVSAVQEAFEAPFLAGAVDPDADPDPAMSGVAVQPTIGVTHGRGPHAAPDHLLRDAYAALSHATRTSQPWVVFDPSMTAYAAAHLEVERDLALALERDELFVEYQPVLDVDSGRIVGAEALVRWRHPARGVVPPLDFIGVAEANGQILDIGRVVLRDACRQAAAWGAAGHPIRVSVNVAAAQLRDRDLPSEVASVLAETGVPPTQLCLEITESSVVGTSAQVTRDLHRLRDLGVQIAIDDFGTGYSSLAYLHTLPVDELKIDRSFISRRGTEDADRHMLEAITSMARALDLGVVAEGVETAAQLETVAALGCDRVQGFLLGRPAAPEALTARLVERRRDRGDVPAGVRA